MLNSKIGSIAMMGTAKVPLYFSASMYDGVAVVDCRYCLFVIWMLSVLLNSVLALDKLFLVTFSSA